jgi:hypothetical protein
MHKQVTATAWFNVQGSKFNAEEMAELLNGSTVIPNFER